MKMEKGVKSMKKSMSKSKPKGGIEIEMKVKKISKSKMDKMMKGGK